MLRAFAEEVAAVKLADLQREVLRAAERIGPHVRRTPVEESPWLSSRTGAKVFLKLESFQRTGSFKLRGALHKLLTLAEDERRAGVVAASSGNHGLGLARAAKDLGVQARVFVPEDTSEEKVGAMTALGARVERFGDDCVETERHARAEAERTGRTYVSPYNDRAVVAGQGTVGVELAEQVPELDAVYVALGGGGLIAGVGAALKAVLPAAEVVACSPANSPAMDECVRVGRIHDVECRPTLSDSTAGGVEAGSVTFDLCRSIVDRYLRVGEGEIESALVELIRRHHLLVEGAAAVPVAGLLRDEKDLSGRRVAVVVCGANIPLETLRQILGAGSGSSA